MEKKLYRVQCGMRPDSGQFPAYTSASTMVRTVEVYATDEADARGAAIDECYRQWGNSIEHVKPGKVSLAD